MDYQKKYLKYKSKYLEAKKQFDGGRLTEKSYAFTTFDAWNKYDFSDDAKYHYNIFVVFDDKGNKYYFKITFTNLTNLPYKEDEFAGKYKLTFTAYNFTYNKFIRGNYKYVFGIDKEFVEQKENNIIVITVKNEQLPLLNGIYTFDYKEEPVRLIEHVQQK